MLENNLWLNLLFHFHLAFLKSRSFCFLLQKKKVVDQRLATVAKWMEVSSGFLIWFLCFCKSYYIILSDRFASGIHVKCNAACVPLTLSYSSECSPAFAVYVQVSLNRLKLTHAYLAGFLTYFLHFVLAVLKTHRSSISLEIRPQSAFTVFRASYSTGWSGRLWQPLSDCKYIWGNFFIYSNLKHS